MRLFQQTVRRQTTEHALGSAATEVKPPKAESAPKESAPKESAQGVLPKKAANQ
jgi:hypothetical protein